MSKVVGGSQFYLALKAEGYELPPECLDVELHVPIDGVVLLHYKVMLTEDTLAQVGRALVRMTQAAS